MKYTLALLSFCLVLGACTPAGTPDTAAETVKKVTETLASSVPTPVASASQPATAASSTPTPTAGTSSASPAPTVALTGNCYAVMECGLAKPDATSALKNSVTVGKLTIDQAVKSGAVNSNTQSVCESNKILVKAQFPDCDK